MSNPPSKNVMTYSEMVVMNEERKASKLFSKDEDAAERISELVSNARKELANVPEKISMRDTETVRKVMDSYMRSCDRTGIIPCKSGAARAMGVSVQGVRSFMVANPDHPTTGFLEIVFDLFSETLNNAALSGLSQPIYSIFLQKAIYGMRDNVTLEIARADNGPLHSNVTADEIAGKYAALPDD